MSTNLSTTFVDKLAQGAARQVSRRRFLRNSGAAALGAALSGAMLGTGRGRAAVTYATSTCSGSPVCASGRCFDGQCSNSAGRHWATSTCWPSHLGGCWTTGCWRCCDCCQFESTSAGKCSSCGDSNTRYKCHCEKYIC
jgi:hypothetical protein